MKAKSILPLLIAAVLVVSISACLGGQQTQTTTTSSPSSPSDSNTAVSGGSESPQQATTTTVSNNDNSGGVVDKIKDLTAAIASGQAYHCTYTYQGVTSESWIKGEKFKSKSTVDSKVGYAISDGVWMYSWVDGEKTGVKFNIEDMKKLGDQQKANSNKEPADMNEIAKTAGNVECSIAAITDGTFTPPSNIEFSDMGQLLKNLQENLAGLGGNDNTQPGAGQNPDSNPCAYCGMIPDANAKQDCLQSCNQG
ncbi:Uncharacterised protein [uncultured archaeon]|nr:Uncharacterised protein [uncultured archaeon]